MVSSLSFPARAERATLQLPDTGTVKVTKVAFPLVYSDVRPSEVLAFVAGAGGEAVQLSLDYKNSPAPFVAVVKLTGARLELPKEEQGRVSVIVSVVLARDDVREPQDLLRFLLEAAHAEALELDVMLQLVQPSLPGFAAEAPAELRLAPGEHAAVAKFFDEVEKLDRRGVTVSLQAGDGPMRQVKGRKRAKDS